MSTSSGAPQGYGQGPDHAQRPFAGRRPPTGQGRVYGSAASGHDEPDEPTPDHGQPPAPSYGQPPAPSYGQPPAPDLGQPPAAGQGWPAHPGGGQQPTAQANPYAPPGLSAPQPAPAYEHQPTSGHGHPSAPQAHEQQPPFQPHEQQPPFQAFGQPPAYPAYDQPTALAPAAHGQPPAAGSPPPATPAVPVAPEEPATTAAPWAPEKPASPAAPWAPEKPAGPAAPWAADEPASPAAPWAPEKPAGPVAPWAPDEPVARQQAGAEQELQSTASYEQVGYRPPAPPARQEPQGQVGQAATQVVQVPAPGHAADPGRADESRLRLVWIYPDLLSTYGDRGNLLILERRATARGLPVECLEVRSDEAMPASGDIYLIGGGEDGPQALAAQRLLADGGLHRAVSRGAVVFAVCAGYQLLGRSFFAKGAECRGLGILDLRSDRGETRAVGELAGDIDPALGLPRLTGFENHGGRTHLGPEVKPLARVTAGIGNDGATEGAWRGRVLGTYSHGPALARNPAIGDLLLYWATGAPLSRLDDTWHDRLRAERLSAVAPA